MLSGHYINRHNAAVRLIADFLLHSSKGASPLHESLRLLAMDAGLHERPMDEDFDDLAAGSEALMAEWASVDLSTVPVGQDTQGSDVSLDVDALRLALKAFEDHQAKAPPILPQYLPDWILPASQSDILREWGLGVTPDLVFGVGVPSVVDSEDADWKRCNCTLILIEVGFCADLRCHLKLQEKREKYEPLLRELRKIWGHVHLVIVPIGNAGTVLERTQQALAEALAANPAHPPIKETTKLMQRLSAFAAQRLLVILQARYCSTAPTQTSQGPVGSRGSQTHSLTQARRPPKGGAAAPADPSKRGSRG
jgi:hypothetical protein